MTYFAKFFRLAALIICNVPLAGRAADPALVLTNHLSYELRGPKHAVIRGSAAIIFRSSP